jgi:hypothetical protein
MSEIPEYPSLEFISKGLRSENGVRVPYEAPFFMDLRGSNATLDHVLHYTTKGYQVVGFHNVSNELLEVNESWAKIASYVNQVKSQATAISKAKPIDKLVKEVGDKINGK